MAPCGSQGLGFGILANIRPSCTPYHAHKGRTKLETAGYAASALVLHPLNWEGVELALASSNAVEHLSLPCLTLPA